MSTHPSTRYVLGLDLGVASIGWALVRFDGKKPVTVEEAGTRIFQSAMTNEKGEISQGREESRNKERRDKRLMRRQLDRRARRHRDLAVLLQSHGLLPEGSINNSAKRHELLIDLERTIAARHAESIPEKERNQFYNTLPYWLRARALQERLTLDELGRTLYHLGQRRGFLSNRKTDRDEDEEAGKVYGGIDELTGFMEESGCETLGQYFATVDPTDPEARRIRGRYTARKMYEHEFERVWESQRPHYPGLLTDTLKKQIYNAIFFQRKLQSARDLIGICEYECRAKGCDVDRKRAPWALELAQRFRIIQVVNNLTYELGSGERYQLSETEWRTLVDKLDREGDLKFSQVKKLLDLKSATFNLEEGGETTLRGNRTSSKLRKVFEDRLDSFSQEDRFQIVEDLRSYEKVEALEKRGREKWGLTPEKAKEFSKINLEADYCNLSRQAMEKLLPLMEEGKYYMSAVTEVYGDQVYEWETEYLGPVAEAPFGELRNPTVFRVLTQLRKVVNRIIKTYGKPDEIRVELARDVKRSKKERQNLAKRMRDQEKARQAAANLILGFDKNFKFSREDIEKVLLMQECNCQCPYTGKMISMGSLLGPNPQFEVEHIVPFSRCLDNSFFNKTLCHVETNRNIKRNRTPHEAFHGTDDWSAMLERVKKFKGRGAAEKLKRFQLFGKALSESVGDFKSSQLNDTRYASRLALEYLRVLYGGDWRKRLLASKGGITAELRSAWKLNSVLNDGDMKTREDHRHHAVDAIAIALASPEMVQIVSQAAQTAEKQGHRRWWKLIQEPWEGFLGDCKTAIDRIVISHAPNKPVRGSLHKETNYSPPKENKEGERVVHVRKSIEALSESEVNKIVDDVVRQSILEKLTESGKTKPADAFKNGVNTPLHKNGKPIRKVRIRSNAPVIPVGENERVRFVSPGNNHHIEIFEQTDKKGKLKWVGRVVSLYECYRRQATGLPVIDREHPDGGRFVFSLCGGDMVEIPGEDDGPLYYVVRSISEESDGRKRLTMHRHQDARMLKDVKNESKFRGDAEKLRCSIARKVSVTALGEIRYAND